jgi:hypothetical protein
MTKRFRSIALGILLIAFPPFSMARDDGSVSGDVATDMVVDVVVIRPLGLATTLVGAVLTVVALPFTIPSGSVESSVQALVVKPAKYTFTRPLGDFSESSAEH